MRGSGVKRTRSGSTIMDESTRHDPDDPLVAAITKVKATPAAGGGPVAGVASTTGPTDPTSIARPTPLSAFTGVGIELEYMIVDQQTLQALPIADRLLARGSGTPRICTTDVVRGAYGWSNELVLHVIEIKNLVPAPTLYGVAAEFAAQTGAIDALLATEGARLLPGAMHPWMVPASETRLWPHENAALYRHFDRIFDCARHGWANVQSMHVNLPFADDAQFERLHAAIRLVLPIIPALAASSPVAGGLDTGCADYRLAVYRSNAAVMPSITADVVPETVKSRAEYEATVLAPMYRAIAPFDPDGVLQHEWLNARGAIARFDRNAIEIRVTDIQECPQADIAIAGAIVAVVRALYDQRDADLAQQHSIAGSDLVSIFGRCVADAENAALEGSAAAHYLPLFGYPNRTCSAAELWRHLLQRLPAEPGMDALALGALEHILTYGSLATRLRRALGTEFSRSRLTQVYRGLADCLRTGRLFGGGPTA